MRRLAAGPDTAVDTIGRCGIATKILRRTAAGPAVSGVAFDAATPWCPMPTIEYLVNAPLTPAEFVDILERSTLGERRPIDDAAAIEAMLAHADLTVTAWDGDRLVGVARTLTDFAFVGYLSELAVDVAYQRLGIGRALVERTRAAMGPRSKLVLLAAPAAEAYYPRIGFRPRSSAWILERRDPLR